MITEVCELYFRSEVYLSVRSCCPVTTPSHTVFPVKATKKNIIQKSLSEQADKFQFTCQKIYFPLLLWLIPLFFFFFFFFSFFLFFLFFLRHWGIWSETSVYTWSNFGWYFADIAVYPHCAFADKPSSAHADKQSDNKNITKGILFSPSTTQKHVLRTSISKDMTGKHTEPNSFYSLV